MSESKLGRLAVLVVSIPVWLIGMPLWFIFITLMVTIGIVGALIRREPSPFELLREYPGLLVEPFCESSEL